MITVDTMQLLSRCRQGDSLAIEALVRTYSPPVYRLALSMLDDPAEADGYVYVTTPICPNLEHRQERALLLLLGRAGRPGRRF
jgi:hypothetical protein